MEGGSITANRQASPERCKSITRLGCAYGGEVEFPRSVAPFLLLWMVVAVPTVAALYIFAPSWISIVALTIAGALLAGGLHTIRSGQTGR